MIIDVILFITGFICIIIASISDIKTRAVPDFISYLMIFSGLSLRALYAVSYNELNYFILAIINLVIFFIIGNLLYYTKQWGGGDTKLLIGISVVFSTYPNFLLNYFNPRLNEFSFPLTILINVLLIGAVYSIIFAIILAIKNKEKFILEFNKINKRTKYLKLASLVISISIIIIALTIIQEKTLQLIYILLSFLLILLYYFGIAMKAVENVCMYKIIPVEKLQEGDWIQNNLFYKNKLIYKKSFIGLTKKQLELIKSSKIKKILIKEGIPFTSVFLISFIISITLGDLFLYFL